jgi:glycine/D-amino acid oxidase-like deaminating enzyme
VQHLLLRSGRSYRRVLEAKVRLVRYSQQLLHELIRDAGIQCELMPGVLYLYREAETLEKAWQRAAAMRAFGFEIEKLQVAKLAELEPAIDASRLAGALHAPGDEAADAALLCRSLAARLRTLGASLYLENEILSIEPVDVRIREVVARRRLRLRARRYGPQATRAARHPRAGVSGQRLLGKRADRPPRGGAAPRGDR